MSDTSSSSQNKITSRAYRELTPIAVILGIVIGSLMNAALCISL